jgi:hypothetical protein
MTDVTLRVNCDHASSPRFSLTFGGGWARVAVTLPPPADWNTALPPFLRASKAVLDALGVVPLPLPKPRVFVGGPDAPADVTDAYGAVFRAWAAILRGDGANGPAAGAEAPPRGEAQRPEENPSTQFTALPPLSALPRPQPSPRLYVPGAALGAPPCPSPSAEAHLVEQMVMTLRTYMGQYGAAPDFRATKTSARGKAYNYIRSTTAQMGASDAVVEEVRRRLASEQ